MAMVSGFTVENMKSLIEMHYTDEYTVHLHWETFCNNGGNAVWLGNFELQFNPVARKPVFGGGGCEQHRHRPACASAQSDQRLC